MRFIYPWMYFLFDQDFASLVDIDALDHRIMFNLWPLKNRKGIIREQSYCSIDMG